MSEPMYHLDYEGRTLLIPADRIRLTELEIDGDVWRWQLTIGTPEPEDQ